jgi:hypothetical protein
MALTKVHNRMIAGAAVNVQDFGAVGDGVTDDTTAIQTAVDTGKEILIPAGTFRITNTITFPGDMRMTFHDGGKILADTGTYSGFYALRAAGSITQISDLGSNATKGDTSLTFASAPSLSFDDTILIFNPADNSWSGFRTEYKAGEFCHVEGISGTTVKLQAPLYDSYVAADVDVYKVNHIAVDLKNPTIESVGSAAGSIYIEFGRNVKITNPQIEDKNNSCIVLFRCVDGDIFGGRCVNKGDGGDDYALSIANSQSLTIHGGYWYARRHATATGGDAQIGCVPCRGLNFIGCRISNDYASNTHAADFHGNAEHCGYYNCLIQGGVSPQGADISIVNCDIYGSMGVGACVYAAEILGGRIRISGNRLYTQTNPQPFARGVVDFGGNSNNAINANTTRDLIVEFTGNTITSEALSAATSLVRITNRGTTKKISVDCSNNHFDVNDFNGALFVQLVSGTADSDFLICDNNTSRVKGKYSLIPEANYVNGLTGVTRAQGYRWIDSVTTSTGASTAAGVLVTFPWRFPREPAVTTAKIDSTYISNRVGIVVANPVSDQTARLILATDDATNFGAAQTIKVCGEAAIREV